MPPSHDSQSFTRDTASLLGWLIGLGGASLILYAAVLPVLRRPARGYALLPETVLYVAEFVLYFAVLLVVWKHRRVALGFRAAAALALGGAVAFRVAMLAAPTTVNPDSWRDLWEGRVLLAGLNTYKAPPASPVYDGLRARLAAAHDPLYQELRPHTPVVKLRLPGMKEARWVPLTDVRSTYGPVATVLFAVPSLLPLNRLWTLRLVMTLFDLGACVLILAMMRALGHNLLWSLAYCWSPVCINAFAERGQVDAVVALFALLAAWLLIRKRPMWAALSLALAVGAKAPPILLAIVFTRYGGRRFLLAFVAAVVLVNLPILLAGPGGFSGFAAMSSAWQNDDSLYTLLALALSPLAGVLNVARATRALLALALVGYTLWLALRRAPRTPETILRDAAYVLAAELLVSPVVYPWYATPMVAFLCFVPVLGLLLLQPALMVFYLDYTYTWMVPYAPWLGRLLKRYREPWRLVAYVPVYGALAAEWWRARRRRLASEADGP